MHPCDADGNPNPTPPALCFSFLVVVFLFWSMSSGSVQEIRAVLAMRVLSQWWELVLVMKNPLLEHRASCILKSFHAVSRSVFLNIQFIVM